MDTYLRPVVTGRRTARDFARSVAILFSLCPVLALAACSPPTTPPGPAAAPSAATPVPAVPVTAAVTTPLPPAAGTTQPVLAWLDTVAMNNLVGNNAGGITLDTLAGHGVDGSVISTGHLADSYPSWMVSEFSTVKAHGLLYVAANVADPLPATSSDWTTFQNRFAALANAAKSAGADGMAMDAEPYGQDDHHWDGADHTTVYNQALQLAPVIKSVGTLIVYPSSNASFPGSYNDLIRAQNGTTNSYADSRFPDFLRGLLDGGVDVTLLDASFHFGVQYSGDHGDWAVGIAHSVALTHQVFPNLHASAMIWPDNDERNGGGANGYFSADQVQYMISAGLPQVDGPFVIYQHQLGSGTITSTWTAYLNAIDAGVQAANNG